MRKDTLFVVAAGLLTVVACTVVMQPGTATVAPQPPPASRPPAPQPIPPPPPPPAQSVLGPALNLPPGQLPAVGECRVWRRGWPPKLQPQPVSRSCAGINDLAPAGAWVLHRPTHDQKVVHVRVIDDRRAGIVSIVRIYDIQTAHWLRDVR